MLHCHEVHMLWREPQMNLAPLHVSKLNMGRKIIWLSLPLHAHQRYQHVGLVELNTVDKGHIGTLETVLYCKVTMEVK